MTIRNKTTCSEIVCILSATKNFIELFVLFISLSWGCSWREEDGAGRHGASARQSNAWEALQVGSAAVSHLTLP